MIWWPVLLIVGPIASAHEATQQVGAAVCRLHVRPTVISLSDGVEATLTIEGPAPVEIELPGRLVDSPAWRVEIGRSEVLATTEGRELWRQSIRLIPLQSGELPLTFRPIAFRTSHEVRLRTLRWGSVSIRVSTDIATPDLSSARPLRSSEPLPQADHSWPTWFWVIVVVLVLLACLVFALHRRRQRPMVTITVEQRALLSLQALDRNLRVESVARDVADVVRRYLGDRYEIAAPNLTTEEVIQVLGNSGRIHPDWTKAVERLLRRCDLAKFAGREWNSVTAIELIQEGEQLIRWMAQEMSVGQMAESRKIASSPGDFSAEVKGVNQG